MLLRMQEAYSTLGLEAATPQQVLRHQLLILFGDHGQLPPVCRCRRQAAAGVL
jgi:hypothetical protein